LRKLATVDDAALLVVACEELHELGDLLHDLKYTGTKGLAQNKCSKSGIPDPTLYLW
jgi:hypothetical protein